MKDIPIKLILFVLCASLWIGKNNMEDKVKETHRYYEDILFHTESCLEKLERPYQSPIVHFKECNKEAYEYKMAEEYIYSK